MKKNICIFLTIFLGFYSPIHPAKKEKKGIIHDIYEYMFPEKITDTKNKLIQKTTAPKKKIETEPAIESKAVAWHTVHETIQKTGYYSFSGNEKIKPLESQLWYAQSAWPFAARNFLKKDHLEIEFSASFADRAFFEDEQTTISPLIFGKKNVELQDFLLISRLLKNERLHLPHPANEHIAFVYKHYATQEINFKNSYNSQVIAINYARHWLDGLVSAGIQIPIVRKSHRFEFSVPRNDKLETDFLSLTPEARNNFLKENPDGISSFITTVLMQKNIYLQNRNHNDNIGCGDITFFINGHYSFAYCKETNLGFQIKLPIAKTRKLNTLWAPDLGNGGFVSFTGHAGFQWYGNHDFLNPHIYSELTFSMIASVDRRVPIIRSYTGTNPGTLLTPRYKEDDENPNTDGFFLYGNLTNFDKNKHFTENDATVKELADNIVRVHIRPGIEWHTRIGNMFKNIIVKNLSCNIFYDALLKGEDSVGFYDPTDAYDRDILKKYTNQHAHRIGGTLQYQFDDTFRINMGFTHLFAGKNIMQTSDFAIGFNASF